MGETITVGGMLWMLATEGAEGRFPAVILLSDGASNRGSLEDVQATVAATGLAEVPVYGINFGDADLEQLEALAELTGGSAFDGKKDLVGGLPQGQGTELKPTVTLCSLPNPFSRQSDNRLPVHN